MIDFKRAVGGMAQIPQWFVWKLTWNATKGKYAKVPVNASGKLTDAQDSGVWATFDAAVTQRNAQRMRNQQPDIKYTLGFCFTADCGYWFYDTDSCVIDGKLNEFALGEYAQLKDCFFEYSSSGNGLHFIGRNDDGAHEGAKKKRLPCGADIEFYTEKRGIAFGLTDEAWGCADNYAPQEWMHRMLNTVLAREDKAKDSDHNGDGAHPDWNGYTDDNELIEAARKMKPKGGRMFDTAWFADLFDGNAEALCRVFPDERPLGYDESSADFALARLFVFHAGRHPERIERLMRMSALQRPKWDRHDYLARTIKEAIRATTTFYDKDYKRPSEAPVVPVELSGWRDPVDLFSNTPVPPFPMECVPPAVRNYAEAISKASGFDAGAYAFSALITAAGHIKHSHRVQINDSYSQGAVLWGGVCDPSGGGKSAIMSASIAPLMAIDKQLAKQGMFKLSEWQANLEQAKKNGEPVPPRPVWQQRIISDTTTEAAGALLEGNDGLLLHADEITEFVGRMDAYSGASGKDRGVWLKSYDGEAVTINRAGRMPVHIPHFSVGIIAGMQPETLARLFNKSGGGAGSDGLFQRFLLYQVRQAVDADFSVVVGESIKQSYIQLFSLIEGWNNTGFSTNATVLDRDAVAAHQEYVNNVRKITARTSSPRFKEHLSKFQAFVIRLALVLHCLECAGRGQYSTQLTLETYNRAKQIMAVLYRHSEAAYLVLDDTLPVTHDLMKSAAEAILSKKFAVVKMGDLTRDATGWRAADGRLKQAAIDGLLELDWLKDITPDHTGRGRPSLGLFAVNPKVSVLFSNQAERITRERAERYETIKEIAAAR